MINDTPEPVDLHVGIKVRARRRALGISQNSLAHSIGVSFQQVQKYENGWNRISASRLVAIGAALECRAADFLPEGEAPPPALSSVVVEMAASDLGLKVAKAFITLSDADKGVVLALIRALERARPNDVVQDVDESSGKTARRRRSEPAPC
ncbi:MAG: helix-turn-helix domain-containing protein [Lacisediminimonas sp.]|nr:helix-turn-helix domain-containing protein [Lacisediminimonas sp.]